MKNAFLKLESIEWNENVKMILLIVAAVLLLVALVLILIELARGQKAKQPRVVVNIINEGVMPQEAAKEEVAPVVEEVVEEQPVEEEVMVEEELVEAEEVVVEEAEGEESVAAAKQRERLRYSFEARLAMSDDIIKERYSLLKNELLAYGMKSRLSWKYEAFHYKRVQLAKFSVRGKTLCLNLALNPADLQDTKYNFDDMSEVKQYEDTPVKIKLKSDRSIKWAAELIAMVAAANELEKQDLPYVNYIPQYKTINTLMKNNAVRKKAAVDYSALEAKEEKVGQE